MLSALDFQTITPAATTSPGRADVACFVGYVGRRVGAPVPEQVLAQWRAAGWLDGPWDVGDRRESLLDLPVVLDSWEGFDQLFAWDMRLLREGASPRCASYLGAAVRAFFASGGRRAVIVRVGDPWPYLGGADRSEERTARLARVAPASDITARPFSATDPLSWRGMQHLYGLQEVSHLCLPDLPDICADEPAPPPVVNPPPAAPEVFVECSADEPALPPDNALRHVQAPRLTGDTFTRWAQTVAAVRGFIATHRRDTLLLAALPLPATDAQGEGDVWAGADWLGFLRASGVLEAEQPVSDTSASDTAASAFVQLGWPWLRAQRTRDLPQLLEPADGALAGVLAANALARGTWRSVAAARMPGVAQVEPTPALGLGPDSPTALLAERICLIGPETGQMRLLSDVTTSPDLAWRQGGVSRLMAALLRAARRIGQERAFDPNGPALWTRVRRDLESLLAAWRAAGALGGARAGDAYQVRCGLGSTMTQNDLDSGRVRVEVTVLPSFAVERITVALELTAGGVAAARLGEVA